MDIQNPTTLQHNTKYDEIYSEKKVHSIDYNAYKPANQGLVQSKPVRQGKTLYILNTLDWNEIAIIYWAYISYYSSGFDINFGLMRKSGDFIISIKLSIIDSDKFINISSYYNNV